MNKSHPRDEYNIQVQILFDLKEKRDKLLAEYFRAQTAYDNAVCACKKMDEAINHDSNGEMWQYPHQYIENKLSNDFVVKEDK